MIRLPVVITDAASSSPERPVRVTSSPTWAATMSGWVAAGPPSAKLGSVVSYSPSSLVWPASMTANAAGVDGDSRVGRNHAAVDVRHPHQQLFVCLFHRNRVFGHHNDKLVVDAARDEVEDVEAGRHVIGQAGFLHIGPLFAGA